MVILRLRLRLILRPTVSQPIYLGVGHPFGAHDQISIFLHLTITFFLLPVLSDERTYLYFAVVRVAQDP
jgi:hypothetical protein